MSIAEDIVALLGAGTPLGNIVVNNGDDRWGRTCATTRREAAEIIDEWQRDGCENVGTVDDLQSAEEWLEENPQQAGAMPAERLNDENQMEPQQRPA